MVVKVVEGEASHALNTSEGEGVDGGGASQTQCMDLSGVMCVLYACEGVHRITPPHPPVHPASLVRPASLTCPMSRVPCPPASLVHPVSLARPTHCQLPLLHP